MFLQIICFGYCLPSKYLYACQSYIYSLLSSWTLLLLFLITNRCLITRNIDRQEWRSILMSVCTFYMMESMLLVFKSYMQWTYWLFTAILYLTFFLSMFRSTEEIVVVLIRQLDHADESSLNVLGNLLLRRLKIMRMFQFTLGFYLLFELLIHLIIDAGLQRLNTTVRFIKSCFGYHRNMYILNLTSTFLHGPLFFFLFFVVYEHS